MHWAQTSAIDALVSRYHRNYLTYCAFFDDAGSGIGNHEEAILLAQADNSPICKLMQRTLPEGTPPEKISAEDFYGDMYFWLKRTLVYGREKTSKQPMPWYLAATRKAFKPGEWNTLRIQAVQDSVKTWLNGVPATDARDAWCRSGFIGFQLHGSRESGKQVRWRSIRIQKLD